MFQQTVNTLYQSFFLFCVIFSFSVQAGEVGYLPAQIQGELPPVFSLREEAAKEMAFLSRHYLRGQFFVETSLVGSEAILRNSPVPWDSLCLESENHFLAQDRFDFGNPVLVETEIYNCKSRTSQKINSRLETNFVLSLGRHIEKAFRFLPPSQMIKKPNQPLTSEINFVIDGHGAAQIYRKDLINYIQSLSMSDNLLLGLYVTRKDKILKFPANSEHETLLASLKEVPFSASNSSDSVLEMIKILIANARLTPKAFKKNVFLFSGSVRDKESALILSLNQLRQAGYENILISLNQSDPLVQRGFEKIAKASSSKILPISDYQRVGTIDGYFNVLLKDGRLYSTTESLQFPIDLSQSFWTKWDAGLVRSFESSLGPYTMAQAFEKCSDRRVVEKGELKSTLAYDLELVLQNQNNPPSDSNSILVETKGESIWIKIPQQERFQIGKEVLVQTEFSLDPLAPFGIQNQPGRTKLWRPNTPYPALLSMLPSQGKKFLESNKINKFDGYILGKVVASKTK